MTSTGQASTHTLQSKQTACKAVVRTCAGATLREEGFVLVASVLDGAMPRLWVEQDAAGHRACMLTLTPRFDDAAAMDAAGAEEFVLVVDLSEVSYISSAGAGVFIAALNDAHEHKGNVVLLSPSSNVREVLEMLGFNQIFSIATERGAAVKAAMA